MEQRTRNSANQQASLSRSILTIGRVYLPSLEPNQPRAPFVVPAAHIVVPVPGRLLPFVGTKPELLAVAYPMLWAHWTATHVALGKHLFELTSADSTRAAPAIVLAFPFPLLSFLFHLCHKALYARCTRSFTQGRYQLFRE